MQSNTKKDVIYLSSFDPITDCDIDFISHTGSYLPFSILSLEIDLTQHNRHADCRGNCQTGYLTQNVPVFLHFGRPLSLSMTIERDRRRFLGLLAPLPLNGFQRSAQTSYRPQDSQDHAQRHHPAPQAKGTAQPDSNAYKQNRRHTNRKTKLGQPYQMPGDIVQVFHGASLRVKTAQWL